MRGDIRHPKELEAMTSLQKNPLFSASAKAFSKWLEGAPAVAHSLSRKFPVTDRTHPRLFSLYRTAAERMEMSQSCPLFLDFNYDIKAEVLGYNKQCVLVLTSASVEILSDDELLALLGHELSYIKFDNLKYLGMFRALDTLPLPRTAADALVAPFLDWMHAAEYTADRAAAWAAGSKAAVIGMLRAAMGLDSATPEIRLDQVSYESVPELPDTAATIIGRTLLKHLIDQTDCPWGVDRIHELSMYEGID